MALGTWKEDPIENAVLNEAYDAVGGNDPNATREQKC